jgi:hypothetical protein
MVYQILNNWRKSMTRKSVTFWFGIGVIVVYAAYSVSLLWLPV